MSDPVHQPIKVLFLAWGYSIHAFRRIQVFCDDPAFEVTVVATYDYGFKNARNILLNTDDNFSLRVLRTLRFRSNGLLSSDFLEALCRAKTASDQLKDITSSLKPEVLFLQTLLYPCYLALCLPKSIPLVITFWNGDVTWWAKWDGLERWLKKKIVLSGVGRAHAVTVNSMAANDACLNYGASQDKIHLIRYPGVDKSRFFPASKQEARGKLGIDKSLVVMAPRGLGEYLNSEQIIEAAALIARETPEVLFMIFCAAAPETVIEKHIEKAITLGIEKKCFWIKQVSWEEMPDYYRASDVMISMATNDSLPNCMLEAMACGVPVVMGDIPQIREWIVDSQNGYLVPLDDPLALAKCVLKVFNSPKAEITCLTQNALARVNEDADSSKMIPKIKTLVTTLARPPLHD